MTGQYAHNHGVKRNNHAPKLNHDDTVQTALDEAGYRTALFGRYLNRWPILTAPPHFDRFATLRISDNEDPRGYYKGTWNVNGSVRRLDGYTTRVVGQKGARFVRESERRDRPWLLLLTPFAPHLPYIPERRYAHARVPRWEGNPAVFEEDKSDKPEFVQKSSFDFETGRRHRRGQLQTLMSVDDLVGRMIRILRDVRARRDTLVMFSSDNGYFWGEHGLSRKSPPYLQGVRVPFVMSWPGHVSAGIDGRLAASTDIAPTIYDASGVRPPTVLDGRSLLDDSWERTRLLVEFWHSSLSPRWFSTVTKDYQYVEYPRGTTDVRFRELYWLADDPWQLTNVLGDEDAENDPPQEFLSSIHAQLEMDRACQGTSCP